MKSTSATRDISGKPVTLRIARAAARVKAKPATVRALERETRRGVGAAGGGLPKPDPVGVAKVAAIQAAKETSRIVPFCHPLPIDSVRVTIGTGRSWIDVETEVTAVWKTGVEMEALTAASAAALTLYDMLKPVDDTLEIVSVRLTHKSGGKSGAAGGARSARTAGRGGEAPRRAGASRRPGAGLRAAVLVVSDSVSGGKSTDRSGKILADGLRGLGARVAGVRVVPDEPLRIARALKDLCDGGKADLLLAAGGTGVGPRDLTAETVASLLDRRLHGVENAFLAHGQDRHPTAMLSRCIAGTRRNSVIVALPGSPGAARDALDALFPALFHAFPMMKGEGHP